MRRVIQFVMAVVMGLLATACANKNVGVPFTATDLNTKVTSGDYVQKVDNFVVLFDDSASMYADKKWQSKVEKAKLVANNMNNTIPNLKLQAGMRAFGPRQFSLADGSALQYGMTGYSRSGLGDAISAITGTGGLTPMSPAIDLSKSDLNSAKGDIAVILISDGLENVDGPSSATAKALKDKYKERICIYPILIGNDPQGRATMEGIAKISECGFASDEETVSTPTGMASFVEKVFLKKAEKVAQPAPAPAPIPVPEPKCFTVELKVEFDFDKSEIRPEYYKELLAFGDFVRKHNNHTVNLEGHTDNHGTDQYNMKLGQRRAEAVRAFLLKNFSDIDPARLTAISYGESKPLDSNESKDGRQKNRRVFATFTCKD